MAVIEVVSPGNKASRPALRRVAEKSAGLIDRGLNLLVIDLLPPGGLDPAGIHPVIRAEFTAAVAYTPPAGEPLTVAAYQASADPTAYVEPCAVGSPVPTAPLFLDGPAHVLVPLDETHQAAWQMMPGAFRAAVEAAAAGS